MTNRRLTRRRFLGASGALVAGAAAYATAGCGDATSRPASPTSFARSSPVAPVVSRGGVLRAYNFDAMVQDTLDPHLTMMGPIANVHSAVFSKLYKYDDEREGVLSPDLADGMPEQPDDTTYIIKLRDGVRFHDAPHLRLLYPQVTGRNLEARDVVYSIERQMATTGVKANRFFRHHNWNTIDSISARDRETVVIKLSEPVAPFVSFLAGRHAFVMPHEVVDQTTGEANSPFAMVGTGPFILEAFESQKLVRLARNPQWFARDDDPHGVGTGRPFLDAYHAFYSPQEDTFQRVWFERLAIDSTSFLDPLVLDYERKTNLADIQLEEIDAGGMLASRLLLDRPPFKDDRARRAVHLAIDRAALAEIMFPPMDGRPSARLSGAVAPGMERWALPDDDLSARPGYRSEAALRAEEVREARQLWDAALGEGSVTELRIFFSGVPKTISERAVALVQRQLSEVLGASVSTVVDESGYAVIASALGRNIDGATEGVVHFTFGFEDGGVDLDDWLYGFHSSQPMNTYRLQDSTLDLMLEKTRREFDYETRRQLGRDVQDYLIGKVNARLEFCAPVSRRLSWGYVRNPHHGMWYGSDYKLANTWLDTSHPAWTRRDAAAG